VKVDGDTITTECQPTKCEDEYTLKESDKTCQRMHFHFFFLHFLQFIDT